MHAKVLVSARVAGMRCPFLLMITARTPSQGSTISAPEGILHVATLLLLRPLVLLPLPRASRNSSFIALLWWGMGGGEMITDAAPSLENLIIIPSSSCSSTIGGNSSVAGGTGSMTGGVACCGEDFGINRGNGWERTMLESMTEKRDDEAAHMGDQKSLRPQLSSVRVSQKMKSLYLGCIDGNDNMITVSSTICSSTTGGTGFVSGGGSHGPCFGIDKGDAAERMFESVPPGRDDTLAYMDPPPLLKLSESKLEVYNSTSMETTPTIDMTEAPSSSYDEGSLCKTYTNSINSEKLNGVTVSVIEVASRHDRKLDPVNTDLSTPRFFDSAQQAQKLISHLCQLGAVRKGIRHWQESLC